MKQFTLDTLKTYYLFIYFFNRNRFRRHITHSDYLKRKPFKLNIRVLHIEFYYGNARKSIPSEIIK